VTTFWEKIRFSLCQKFSGFIQRAGAETEQVGNKFLQKMPAITITLRK